MSLTQVRGMPVLLGLFDSIPPPPLLALNDTRHTTMSDQEGIHPIPFLAESARHQSLMFAGMR